MRHWAIGLSLVFAPPLHAAPAVVASPGDLPPTRFALSAPPSQAFLADDFLRDTVPALRREGETLLATRRITDPAIVQGLRLGLAAIAILQGRPADAEVLIAAQRAVETKPQLRAVGFLLPEAIAAGGCPAAAARVTERLRGTDPIVVRDEVLVRLGRVAVASDGYYAGTAVGRIDVAARARGSVDVLDGMTLAYWRVEARGIPPCRSELDAALRAWLAAPANRIADIWPGRDPAAAALAGAKPVTVAVWDSGFDPALFPGQLVIDPAEPLDGRDNDGNGVVDDSGGPTFDSRLRPIAAPYPPPSAFLALRLGLQMAVSKGERDLGYGDDTQDARFFAQRGREASTAEQGDDVDGGVEFGARSHGSWVASTIADGAPYVRLYNVFALPFGDAPRRLPITEAEIARWVAAMPALGARMRGAGVRVVNTSWGFNADEVRENLLETGVETDPERARKRGAAMFAQVRPALDRLIRDCPGILFVAGAGNSNQPGEIFASVPQSLKLPNIIIVGAAGASGTATVFTTFGANVALYARGEGVAVRAPGGQAMRVSGTSLAGPMVARAAASMLAVNPRLTPAALVEGLVASATLGNGGLRLLHPAQAVAWAAARTDTTTR